MYHARRKNWPKAAEDLSRAVQSDPFQMGNSYLLAVLLVQAERYSEYQDLCDRVLAHSESATPDAARRNAKTCLIAAPREQALPRIEKLAEAALSAPGPFFKLASTVKGLLEYREKHYAEAQKFLQEAVGMNGPNDPAMEAQTRLVLAMACAELKQTEEARKHLAEADKLTQGLRGHFEEMGRDYEERLWVESLTNEILLREARALVHK
jgi:tetratricopeptide (TPR) repeat protein